MTKIISEKAVLALPKPTTNKLHFFSGSKLQGKTAPSGFAVRVTPAGTKAFVWCHRVNGKQHIETIGTWRECGGTLSVLDAIEATIKRAKQVDRGVDEKGKVVDPLPKLTRLREERKAPKATTITGLLDEYLARYVAKEAKLRSADAIKSIFDRLVKPAIGDIGIYSITRKPIIDMLDDIADNSGPVMADRTLAHLRSALNWFAVRDETFKSPIVKGMARTKPNERAGRRILSDDEIRDVWLALDKIETPSCYPRYVRTLLLTATRRSEASEMHQSEIDGDLWTIPAARYKTKTDHVIPLSADALELIGEPKGFAFSTDGGKTAFSGFSKCKIELDRLIAKARVADEREPLPNWTLHDLRRTARSLMSRAGVSSDHAERCLGHVILGVEKTYDRYSYLDEKRAAFAALASLVGRILNPENNVVPLRA